MYSINKEFHFSYGHRVWTQKLIKSLSLDSSCVCKHLHGHNGVVTIYLKSKELENGFVTDFKNLNWFKSFIDNVLDHKFIFDINDPLNDYEFKEIDFKKTLIEYPEGYMIFDKELYKDFEESLIEKYEGIVFVNFCPTSENLAKWFYDIVKKKLFFLDNVIVKKVEVSETPKTKSTYKI